MDTDEYPSARAALFDSDKIVNIRCFLKYLLWHGAYILLGLVGILFYAGAKLYDKLSRGGNGRAVNAVSSGVSDPRVKKVSRYAVGALVVVYFAGVLAFALYTLITLLMANPVMTIVGIVVGILLTVALILGVLFGAPLIGRVLRRGGRIATSAASKAGSKAKETPGLRRVYGQCPVSMDQPPRYFERIFGED